MRGKNTHGPGEHTVDIDICIHIWPLWKSFKILLVQIACKASCESHLIDTYIFKPLLPNANILWTNGNALPQDDLCQYLYAKSKDEFYEWNFTLHLILSTISVVELKKDSHSWGNIRNSPLAEKGKSPLLHCYC